MLILNMLLKITGSNQEQLELFYIINSFYKYSN